VRPCRAKHPSARSQPLDRQSLTLNSSETFRVTLSHEGTTHCDLSKLRARHTKRHMNERTAKKGPETPLRGVPDPESRPPQASHEIPDLPRVMGPRGNGMRGGPRARSTHTAGPVLTTRRRPPLSPTTRAHLSAVAYLLPPPSDGRC